MLWLTQICGGTPVQTMELQYIHTITNRLPVFVHCRCLVAPLLTGFHINRSPSTFNCAFLGADWKRSACFNPLQRPQSLQFKNNGRGTQSTAKASKATKETDIYNENPGGATSKKDYVRGKNVNTQDSSESESESEEFIDDYPLIVDEVDPNWPEGDDDGFGFKLSEFFNEVKIKNERDDDDADYLTEDEMDWEDDNYIRAVKELTGKEWENAVVRDISPLVVLVYNRYKRGRDYMEVFKELEKAIQIFWDSNMPSPRAVKVDAVIETDLVSALKVNDCPVILFIKAGKILHRETEILTSDELSKIMAYFYYGASMPSCLKGKRFVPEKVPSVL